MAAVPTLNDVLDHLNITDERQSVEVAGRLSAAVGMVERRAGPLAPREVVEDTFHEGGPRIFLRERPALSLTDLRTVASSGPSAYAWDGSYYLDGLAGVLVQTGGVRLPTGHLRVTYQAGRPASGLPDELHEAVLLQTAILWESQRSGGGARPLGGGNGSGPSGISARARRLEECLTGHELGLAGIA